MKSISDYVSNLTQSEKINYEAHTDETLVFFKELSNESPISEEDALIINYIFYRLKNILPTMNYSMDCSATIDGIRREYLFEIRKANLNSLEDINRGLERIRNERVRWIPVPGDFVDFCKPSALELGCPPHEIAYLEAIALSHPQSSKDWSCVEVKAAVALIGSFEFYRMDKKKSREVFDKAYTIVLNNKRQGKILPALESKHESEKPSHEEPLSPYTRVQKKNWERYRNGAMGVTPPLDGWFSEEKQAILHDDRLEEYKKDFAARGVDIPDYSHLNSRDKAMPVIMELLAKMDKRNKSLKGEKV